MYKSQILRILYVHLLQYSRPSSILNSIIREQRTDSIIVGKYSSLILRYIEISEVICGKLHKRKSFPFEVTKISKQ